MRLRVVVHPGEDPPDYRYLAMLFAFLLWAPSAPAASAHAPPPDQREDNSRGKSSRE